MLTFAELGTQLEAVAEEGFKYPPERQMFVIEMMQRFELLFDFEGQTNQKFLLPGLLPLEQPRNLTATGKTPSGSAISTKSCRAV